MNTHNVELNKIKHDMRNLKILTDKQIEIVLVSSDKDKNEIIKLYNEIIRIWSSYFDADKYY